MNHGQRHGQVRERFGENRKTLERCKSWNPKLKRGWTNHPEKPDEKTVQTLEAQAETVRIYSSETSFLTITGPRKNEQQATRTTKRRRRKSEKSWTAASPIKGAARAKTRNKHCMTYGKRRHIFIPGQLRAMQIRLSEDISLQVDLRAVSLGGGSVKIKLKIKSKN